jgi:hypothetical protein
MNEFLVTVLLASKLPEDLTKKTVPPPGPMSPTTQTPPWAQVLLSAEDEFGERARLKITNAKAEKRINTCLVAEASGLVGKNIWL